MKDVIYVDPKAAFVNWQTDAPVIALKYSEKGFYPIYTQAKVEDLNPPDVTQAIRESAIMGSMFGWDVPGADLAREYLENRIDKVE
jgi:hypothetical protein